MLQCSEEVITITY